jgi:hypothetical protein
MTQQSTEERLAALEKEVVELKRQLTERFSFEELRTDLRMRIHAGNNELRDEIHAESASLRAEFEAHEQYVSDRLNDFEAHIDTRLDEQKKSIEKIQESQLALQSGQDQILAILTGKAKTND